METTDVYGKVFSSIYDGTLYGEWEAIVTMQQLIVLCDKDGIVDMTPAAIAARTSIPRDIIDKGLTVLAAPDAGTRTPGADGRRIELIDEHRDWGWRLVNHSLYRNLSKHADKRRADRERKAAERDSQVIDSTGLSHSVASCREKSRETRMQKQKQEAEAVISSPNGDSSHSPSESRPKLRSKTIPFEQVTEVLSYLGDKVGKGFRWRGPDDKPTKAAELVKALLKRGYTVADFQTVIDKKCADWRHDDKMSGYLQPSTLFRPSKFQEYLDQ